VKQAKQYFFYAPLFLLILGLNSLQGRSIHRPKESWLPSISTCWLGDNTRYTLTNSHLEEYPLFKLFDKNYFYAHLLPDASIPHRYDPQQKTTGTCLNELIEHLLTEVTQQKKTYTHFTMLQKRDFNRKRACGSLIVKFKDYPFVLKLFMETPKSFVNQHCKGFVPMCLFYMGSGANRHLTGFTRLKNLDLLNKRIATNPRWSQQIDTPRKWFWLPKQPRWFEITGKNIGEEKNLTTLIPSVYGVIADAIDIERTLSFWSSEDKKLELELCNFFELTVDPHITNFVVEKKTGKLVIIDTEHFPTIVGLRTSRPFDSYVGWLLHLSNKFLNDTMFQAKCDRKFLQHLPSYTHLT
jgi:hypothetical protein